MLAHTKDLPHDLDVVNAEVFFATQGEDDHATGDIFRVSATGGEPTAVARKQANPHQVTVAGEYVYWLAEPKGDGAVMRAPVRGGPAVRVASTFIFADGALAADAKNIYWVDRDKLMRAEHGSSSAQLVVQVGNKDELPKAMAAHGGRVYWFSGGTLWEADVAKGTARSIITGPQNVWGLAVDSTGIFWSDKAGQGEVRKVLFGSPAAAVVDHPVRLPWGVALDETFVYWASNAGSRGAILRATKKGETIQAVAAAQDSPVDVAVSGGAIYWTNAGSHDVMMLLKDP